ncbi:MAG: hypothetical protein KKC68_08650 [Candidatus Thermoplasmatota archaeon]|nr:hypothetical protein [Candidatus Thermoplasmatota archaeon]MBU1941828.1 hypothetical protein [Candidatus Thermoplasmatota archaeon]
MKREPAWRLFAAEYNATQKEIKGREQKTPSYIITPLGAKVNRVFIVGVLTDVENITEGKDFLRAHVSDPSGVYTLYSGQYQQDATETLATIDVPAYVAVIGKTRTYIPEEGQLFVSIRPEIVQEVTAQTRDRWILQTCQHTKKRLDAINEISNMVTPSIEELQKLNYPRYLAEGAMLAKEHYETVDIQRYAGIIRDALDYVFPTNEPHEKSIKEIEIKTSPKINDSTIQTKDNKNDAPKAEETEEIVMHTIKKLEGDLGAAWDLIVEQCKKQGLDESTIEESLASLMDKGFIFEPVLGTIKTT